MPGSSARVAPRSGRRPARCRRPGRRPTATRGVQQPGRLRAAEVGELGDDPLSSAGRRRTPARPRSPGSGRSTRRPAPRGVDHRVPPGHLVLAARGAGACPVQCASSRSGHRQYHRDPSCCLRTCLVDGTAPAHRPAVPVRPAHRPALPCRCRCRSRSCPVRRPVPASSGRRWRRGRRPCRAGGDGVASLRVVYTRTYLSAIRGSSYWGEGATWARRPSPPPRPGRRGPGARPRRRPRRPPGAWRPRRRQDHRDVWPGSRRSRSARTRPAGSGRRRSRAAPFRRARTGSAPTTMSAERTSLRSSARSAGRGPHVASASLPSAMSWLTCRFRSRSTSSPRRRRAARPRMVLLIWAAPR